MAPAPSYNLAMKSGRHGMCLDSGLLYDIPNAQSLKVCSWQSAERYLNGFYSKNVFLRLWENYHQIAAILGKARSIGENPEATQERKVIFREASKVVKAYRKRKAAGGFKTDAEYLRERVMAYSKYAAAMNELEGYFGNAGHIRFRQSVLTVKGL
ncbi:hypothetical protein H634G_11216 [Metarhizium anisopliae BRIP 53293]|uniref:Uncharacterized protein n=1 Tax=Metarhizium anisopliae BRIP 53293 TaxID=1291518 RepID=A0A0D9NLR0_METAN|nr:hypothetical protein H634G_11216 [Metarhizium anisopliae BRIP 53293]